MTYIIQPILTLKHAGEAVVGEVTTAMRRAIKEMKERTAAGWGRTPGEVNTIYYCFICHIYLAKNICPGVPYILKKAWENNAGNKESINNVLAFAS